MTGPPRQIPVADDWPIDVSHTIPGPATVVESPSATTNLTIDLVLLATLPPSPGCISR